MIPIGNKKVKLEPKEKEKFTVLKSDDPKAQILYQDLEFGNYMLFTKEDSSKKINGSQDEKVFDEDIDTYDIWTLEFDGSCASSGSRAGVVLISPKWESEPLVFKLQFGNTNNIVEYEALILGIVTAKEKGIKILNMWLADFKLY